MGFSILYRSYRDQAGSLAAGIFSFAHASGKLRLPEYTGSRRRAPTLAFSPAWLHSQLTVPCNAICSALRSFRTFQALCYFPARRDELELRHFVDPKLILREIVFAGCFVRHYCSENLCINKSRLEHPWISLARQFAGYITNSIPPSQYLELRTSFVSYYMRSTSNT